MTGFSMKRSFAAARIAARSSAFLSLVTTLLAALAAPAHAQVKIESVDQTLQVTINGEAFTTYRYGADLPKPYFWPVRSAGGAFVTRSLEKPEDHPHHKGLWISVDEVNGIKFWVEQGKIVNRAIEILQAEGDTASFKAINAWQDKNGNPVLIETTTVTIDANRFMAFDITLSPGGDEATFEDTKEGFLAIRVPNGMRESDQGHVTNADGLKTADKCWGKTAVWVNYDGPVDGETHGVTIFDHPGNPHPGRYHVRDYGLFGVSPFGDKAYTNGKEPPSHVNLNSGEVYRLRYAVHIHAGAGNPDEINKLYQAWAR